MTPFDHMFKNIVKKTIVSLVSLILGLFLLVGSVSPAIAAPPENFQTQQIVSTGLNQPSGFEIAPDGRIFILQREGQIRVVKNGELLEEPFADLPSVASGDRGLIGIAFDPQFNITNHYVYFYYTGLDLRNRLIRFDASSDVGQNPLVIYQTNSPSQELHVGGSIRFGPDGKMYFAVGDNGYPPNAQNLSNPHGKILRINKDGSIPVDNPFFGQPGALPEIWAYGMRNPWRFQFDPQTGEMFGGDVGDYTWEEVNHIVRGGNYGWPAAEGMCNGVCPYINPIYSYLHQGDFGSAVTGGPIYRGSMFPEEYQGDYFFGDYGQGFIRKMDLDENGNNLGVTDFDSFAGTVVDLKEAPDGSLYYLTIFPGVLYRVSYSTDSHIPVANASSDVTKGMDPLTVNFSSEGSMDPDEDPITFLWEFGDGTTSTQANPTKIYPNKGTYTVQLTVSDQTGSSKAVPIVIQVGQPPVVTIGSPTEGDTYRAGDEIHTTAHAIDAAGLDLNDAAIKTEVILHHNTHIHPFLGPLTGRAHTFNTPDHGEASADTWFEIKVTATDSNGLSDTESVNIYPIKSQLTFNTAPAGLKVLLDGSPHITPHVIEGVEKFKREIDVNTVQEVNGEVYVFDHWSDNGSQRHQIITPQDDTTYTAHFRPATMFEAEYFNNQTLTGEPVLTRQEAKIDYIYGEGSPDPLIQHDQFSARWTKEEYFSGGRYKFTTATDDGVRLYIDGQLKIDEWHGNNAAFSTTVDLTPGFHEIKMEYFEGFSLANARLEWDLSQEQPTETPTAPFNAEYFDNTNLGGEPVVTRQDAQINFAFGDGSPDPDVPTDQFSARWTKTEFMPGGIYTFTTTADDGVRVYLDDELILDKWILQGATEYTVEKPVTEGEHTIKVEYFEYFGGSTITFDYEKTAELPVVNGFAAEYFDNKTLSGEPVVTRTDAAINFNWKDNSSPDPLIPLNNFSARWTKVETFANDGTYEFSITADDGFKLYIDNELALDQWHDQSSTTHKVQKALTAGEHTIVLEYYEAWGDATAMLSYGEVGTPPPPTTGVWTGQYFNNMALGAPVVLTRSDATIDFDWAGASPDPLINANDFSVRWAKLDTFEAADYKFTVVADDGIRVYVDDELILDEWHHQSPTEYVVTKAMSAGDHTIKVEYFENGGGAVAKASYAKVGGAPTTADENYTAKYWNKQPGSAPLMPQTAPLVTREEAVIDNTWQGGSPDALITNNHFIAQWTKNHEFEAGTYTFSATADDGIRVFIDDQPIINKWQDQSGLTYTEEKEMTAGIHTIRVEYYENWGDATAKFSFDKNTTTPPATADYTARFWNIPDNTPVPAIPATTPDLERIDTEINNDWDIAAPGAGVNPNFFVAQWTKQATFEAGEYTFTTTSDDGIRVYVDDELVINDWNDHGETETSVQKTMTAGQHIIKVEYYDKWWTATAKFSYEKTTGGGTTVNNVNLQPDIASYVYDDQLQNGWVNWSWDSIVDFASTFHSYKGATTIKWNPTNAYAGLYFHNDAGFNTAGFKEITFGVRPTRDNQKLELIFFDDQNNIIGQPIKLSDYGGDPINENFNFSVYTIPLSDLGASNRIIKGFHIKDISGDTANEIYVDSVGFVAN